LITSGLRLFTLLIQCYRPEGGAFVFLCGTATEVGSSITPPSAQLNLLYNNKTYTKLSNKDLGTHNLYALVARAYIHHSQQQVHGRPFH